MMAKNHSFFFIILLLPLFVFAQNPIQNAGFEDWTAEEPDNWVSNNIPGTVTVITQSATAHNGSYAVRGENGAFGPGIWPASITAGTSGDIYLPVTQNYAKLSGYYQLNTSGTDFIGVMASLLDATKQGIVASIAESISDTTSEYTYFSFDFDYTGGNGENAAFLNLQFTMSWGAANQIGSYFLLDDVEISSATDLEHRDNMIPAKFKLAQNHPNPFNPSTTIEYSIPKASEVEVNIYNMVGKKVKTLINKNHSPGNYQMRWDGSNQASGIYIYQIKADDYIHSKKMLLVK